MRTVTRTISLAQPLLLEGPLVGANFTDTGRPLGTEKSYRQSPCACLGRAHGGMDVMAPSGKPPAGGVPEAGWGQRCLCAEPCWAGMVCCRKQSPKQRTVLMKQQNLFLFLGFQPKIRAFCWEGGC